MPSMQMRFIKGSGEFVNQGKNHFDELADAFDANAFHAGMDEVFIIGSEFCPRCKGKDPAKLFAKAVNDLQTHIVDERKLQMLIWGDRLLDAKALDYSLTALAN